jgi:hypothetical protein
MATLSTSVGEFDVRATNHDCAFVRNLSEVANHCRNDRPVHVNRRPLACRVYLYLVGGAWGVTAPNGNSYVSVSRLESWPWLPAGPRTVRMVLDAVLPPFRKWAEEHPREFNRAGRKLAAGLLAEEESRIAGLERRLARARERADAERAVLAALDAIEREGLDSAPEFARRDFLLEKGLGPA